MQRFSDEECCHVVGRVCLGLENPLSKGIIGGSWLYRMVSWVLWSDGRSREEVQKGLKQHGDTAPVLETSAQLLSGAWDADTKQPVAGKFPESMYKLFTLRNACFHRAEQLCAEPQPKEPEKANQFHPCTVLPRSSSS